MFLTCLGIGLLCGLSFGNVPLGLSIGFLVGCVCAMRGDP